MIKHVKRGYDIWKIATVVLGVLFLVSIFTNGFSFEKKLSKEQVRDTTLAYLTKILQGQATATISEITEESGLYKIKMTVGDRPYTSYATKDGVLLFPSSVNMTEPVETAAAETPKEIPKTEKPVVQLFTMAYCPYGNQAETGIVPVVSLLGSSVEIEPHYVIYANYQGGGSDYCMDSGKYCSMHGINELKEDVRELCIYKYSKSNFWSYISDVNNACTVSNIATCWEAVAKKHSIDTAKISACEKDEALALLAKEVDLNTKYGVSGSPMLLINGAEYSGGRTAENYKQAICSAFTKQPAECSKTLSATAAAASGSCN